MSRHDFKDHLQATIEQGVDRIMVEGAAAGVGYVLSQAGVFSGGDKEDFVQRSYFGIGREGLWNKDVETDEAIDVLSHLPDTLEWAGDVADLGNGLAQDGDPIYRESGQAVLRLAASMFEQAYTDMLTHEDDVSLSAQASVLIEDYFRVAALQDEAGDKEGATETTLAVVPHLIDITAELDENPDAYDRLTLENNLSSAIQHLGSLRSEEARQMFSSIHNENFRRILLGLLQEKFASDLLAVDEVDKAVATLAAVGQEPLGLWNTAEELMEAGEKETVQRLIDSIKETFPNYYAECGNVVVMMTPMIGVLAANNRDNLLVQAFNSALEKDEDISELCRLAYVFGRRGLSERLKTIAEPLGLDAEHNKRVYEAYQLGVDTTQEEAPVQSSTEP